MQIKNRKTLTINTPQSSATQLMTTADMKNFLRVDVSTDDSLIDEFIKTATENISQFIRRSLLVQTVTLTMDNFGGDRTIENSISEGWYDLPKSSLQGSLNDIHLPLAPVASITSITTYDRSNVSSVFDSTQYNLDATGGRIYLNIGYQWPWNLRDRNAAEIKYVCGYGFTSVPLPLKQAVRMYAAAMYDCRRACSMPQEIIDMVSPYRLLDVMGYV